LDPALAGSGGARRRSPVSSHSGRRGSRPSSPAPRTGRWSGCTASPPASPSLRRCATGVVGRPYAVESHQWVPRWWDQRRRARHELGRRHDAGLLAILDAVTDPASSSTESRSSARGRARAVAEQSFTRGGQPARHADASMEIELQVLCTEASNGLAQIQGWVCTPAGGHSLVSFQTFSPRVAS